MKVVMKRILIILLLIVLSLPTLSAQENGRGMVLTLNDCIEMASKENIAVRNSHLDYLSAKMQKREALASYFPTVNALATGFQAINPLVRIELNDLFGSSDAANNLKYYLNTEASMAGISTTYSALSNAYGAGLMLTQPIYAGGRIVNGNRLAALGIESAKLQENISRRDAVSEIERKYWLVVSLEEKMNVIESAIALADELLKNTQSALNAGLMTDNEMNQVQIKRQELRAQRVRLKGGIMLARLDLCEALGVNGSEALQLRLEDRIPETGSPQQYWTDPSVIVNNMDESRLLEMAVRQKQIEKNMAMGEALPQIGIGASYGYGHVIGAPQMNGALYATVKIPLTEWGKTANKMNRINYQKEKAENDREHYGAMLQLKVNQQWVEVESCWEELALKQENVSFAQKIAERAEADLAAGLATASDVMEKQVSLATALCEEVDARIAYHNALTEYKAAIR